MDRNKAITAEDLIRRYDLENLKTVKNNVKVIQKTLENQYTIVKQYIQNTSNYTNQVNSITWFYNGTPSLNNEPFKSFSEQEKPSRINNLYYDRETGNVYRLIYSNNTYSWELLNDIALSQSLAIANSDADSQDNKRRIFYTQPTPSYEIGDIWVNDKVIMRCRCSRDGDSFKDSEWVEQDNYSEAGVLLDVRAVLNSLITDVTNNYVTTSRLETTKNTIEAEVTSKLDGVDDANGNVTAASVVLAVNGSDSSVSINGNKINISANDILNLLAGNTINLTSKNIVIDSTNFSVDTAGNMTCNNATINGTISKTSHSQYEDTTITLGDPNNTGNALEISGTGGFKSYMNPGNFVTYYNNNITTIVGYGYTIQANNPYGETIFKADGYYDTTEIKKLIAGNIDSGGCTLNSSTLVTVYFNKTFASTPKVVITPHTSTAGVIAGKIRDVTTTYFTAIIGGNVSGNIDFDWIAIA